MEETRKNQSFRSGTFVKRKRSTELPLETVTSQDLPLSSLYRHPSYESTDEVLTTEGPSWVLLWVFRVASRTCRFEVGDTKSGGGLTKTSGEIWYGTSFEGVVDLVEIDSGLR